MRSFVDGPLIVYGDDNPVSAQNADKGPSQFYQGIAMPDPRYLAQIRGAPGIPGYPAPAFAWGGRVNTLDITPTLGTTTQVAAAAATTAGTAMALATTSSTGRVPLVPLVPFGSAWAAANVVYPKLALDFGFLIGTTVAASKNVTIAAGTARYFLAGQKLILGEGGGTGVPQVVTVAATPAPADTTLALVEAVVASKTGTAIGFAHPSGLGAWPYAPGRNGGAGPTFLMSPGSMTARVLSITATNGGATGGNFAVVGYDAYGVPMHETIVHAGAGTTAYGLKAWKYITSITPDFTDTQTYSAGTGDVFGLPLRSDFFVDTEVAWVTAWLTAATGYLAGVLTVPTAATGDVRGTIQLGVGGGGTGYTTSPDAARRLKVFQSIPTWMQQGATLLNPEHLFGQTQF